MEFAHGLWGAIIAALWSAGAAGCLIAALWLQRRRQTFGPAQQAVIVAAGVTGLSAITGALAGIAASVTSLAESLRNLAWLFALYRLFAVDGRHASMGPVRPLVAALVFVELTQSMIWAWLVARGLEPEGVMFRTLTMFHLLVAIGALVMLHNLYGGASSLARRVLLGPCAAMALIWMIDLNVYAIGYIAGTTPTMLAALRGLIGLPVAALLVLGGMGAAGNARFRPSRTVAFRSASLLLIGGYLAALVAVSQWLARSGGDFVSLLQLALVAAAIGATVVVLPSRRIRGWLQVTLAKHLFQHRYDYRSEWLRFTRTIAENTGDHASLEERVIRAIADITDSPAGLLLTPSDAGPFELAASWQWPMAQVPAEALHSAAVRAIEARAYVADLDALRAGRADPATLPPLPEWLLGEPRAWALVPLLHFERMVGAVVLARPAHARLLDWEDFDLLRVAGQQLASYLAEHSGQAALAEAARFDDFHRRIAFVMHDIKNLASQMALLARNAEQHAENPDFRADMLVTLRNSADKLNALLARLSRYGSPAIAALEPMRADEVAATVVDQLKTRHPVVLVEREHVKISAERGSLEQVLLHLVQNAIDASGPDATVFVRVAAEQLYGLIEVTDSGSGMSPEFVRSRLFKPFDSTKQGGFGIGAYEARELVRAMRGRLDVESREGLGTRFTVRLPRADTAQMITKLAAAGGDEKRVA
ncbi:MAG: XrtA/PEP-CTERM system histidine kinase PrsK [Novosphingobium sp.]